MTQKWTTKQNWRIVFNQLAIPCPDSGIENCANWTLDALWKEDTAPLASDAMEFVAYLRMLAFNIVARIRVRKLRAAQNTLLAWKELLKFFEHELCKIRAIAETEGTATQEFV